jgi:hypothetical protein
VNIVILNWQRPLWEGNQEVVKRSGKEEPIWVVIHINMETSLNSYLYLKLARVLCFSYYLFSSTKSENKRTEQVLPGGRGWGGGGGDPNNVYTCK